MFFSFISERLQNCERGKLHGIQKGFTHTSRTFPSVNEKIKMKTYVASVGFLEAFFKMACEKYQNKRKSGFYF